MLPTKTIINSIYERTIVVLINSVHDGCIVVDNCFHCKAIDETAIAGVSDVIDIIDIDIIDTIAIIVGVDTKG